MPRVCASTATMISEDQIGPRTASTNIAKFTQEECVRNVTVSGIIMQAKVRSQTPTIETRSKKIENNLPNYWVNFYNPAI